MGSQHRLPLIQVLNALLEDQSRALDGALRHIAGRVEADEVSVDAEGRLHAAKIDAIADPPSLTELRSRCEAMLPEVDIGELVLEVMTWEARFLEAFTAVSGGQSRLADLHVSVAAGLTHKRSTSGTGPSSPRASRRSLGVGSATSTRPTCGPRTSQQPMRP